MGSQLLTICPECKVAVSSAAGEFHGGKFYHHSCWWDKIKPPVKSDDPVIQRLDTIIDHLKQLQSSVDKQIGLLDQAINEIKNQPL